jgi:pyruvate ferredoxin oxidoreductase beta subunit
VLGTAKDVVDELRTGGLKAGVLGITSFRPFPDQAIRDALTAANQHLVVLERALSPGTGGIVTADLRTALAGRPASVMSTVVAGLGGRAITSKSLRALLAKAAAVASGVAAALKAQGRTDIRVVAQGGDGGTVDIGMACLSGMFERNDDVLYICYDNQAYMNTGVQRSGATPPAARTATTRAVGPQPGNRFGQGKNVPLIAMAHEIGYVATATVADLRDLEYKAARAMDFHGARYLHILVPCPLGWGSSPADTVKVARLATESGLFPVFEAETGQVVSSTPIRHRVPVTDYLRLQARYAHLFRPAERTETIARIQAVADRNIARFGLMPDNIFCRTDRGVSIMHKPFAITLDVGSSRANHTGAWRTERPSTCTTCRPATTPARPGRTSSSGCTTPRKAAPSGTRPPGGRSWTTTRSRPSWAGSATGRARPPATGPSSTRPWASTR